ncbi:4Fe-4S binding protein [bacterium]|nr:4Fe-4S binding protein [bacterium]
MAGKGWKDIPIGGLITEAGNAEKYKTGDWRTFKPVRDKEKCTDCLFCWIYCPDSAVIVEDGKIKAIDYDHCKGCGICAEVCPKKCIEMVKE